MFESSWRHEGHVSVKVHTALKTNTSKYRRVQKTHFSNFHVRSPLCIWEDWWWSERALTSFSLAQSHFGMWFIFRSEPKESSHVCGTKELDSKSQSRGCKSYCLKESEGKWSSPHRLNEVCVWPAFSEWSRGPCNQTWRDIWFENLCTLLVMPGDFGRNAQLECDFSRSAYSTLDPLGMQRMASFVDNSSGVGR